MDYPFEDKTVLTHTVEETKEQSPELIIYNHDIKIQELNTRLCSLELLVEALKFAINQNPYMVHID